MKKIFILPLFVLLFTTACVNLDIPKKNSVTDEALLTNAAGMRIYLARMYSTMPFEDFKYTARRGFEQQSWMASPAIDGTGEAVNRAGDLCSAFSGEGSAYWNDGNIEKLNPLPLLRDANYLIENLPKYKANYAEIAYNHYVGEAYFVRAFVFYTMAKRFGGIPLVTRVINYPAPIDEMEISRSSEEETWDQVLADFNMAISLLQPNSMIKGCANKYVALTYKAEAMNYAGSVAKYNETVQGRLTGLGSRTGVRVIGFAENSWQDASKRYFKEAYLAANEVIKSGGYSLYKTKWSATDSEAQYQNMVDMFSDLSSPENILVKEYINPGLTHGIDCYSGPFGFGGKAVDAGTCPTLDFLELFDGFDRYPDGTIKVTTGNSNKDGDYLLWDVNADGTIAFFDNAEPRLRAYVIFPQDMFKGQRIDVRAGIYTGPTPVAHFFNDYSFASATDRYNHLPIYNSGEPKGLLRLSTDASKQDMVVINPTLTMPAAGAHGPFISVDVATLTGLYMRKWLNPDPAFVAGEGKSAQPFILLRYADVLLAAAEAAVELSLWGEASPDGSDMLQVATKAINDIRERAGAILLPGNLTGDNNSRNTVRKERRKELAFEHKSKWDIRRWRVQHEGALLGFWGEDKDPSLYSSSNQYRMRGLYPFYSSQTGKYFFDARMQWISLKTFEFNSRDYYFEIPEGEVAKSLYIDQQPNRY